MTASALLTGCLIVGCNDPGTCGMHKCELIKKHTKGQVKHSKQVVDSFLQMKMFRSKIRRLACCIMDMKQKSKYKQSAKFMQTLNNEKQPLKLETPIDTRIAGTMMMYQSMLRSYCLSMNLQTNTPAAVAISPLLVCSAQLKLPRTGSKLVRNIVCLTSNKPVWHGIRGLHKDLPKENKKLIDCMETTQMLAARLLKKYKQYFTHQHRDDFIAMFCHPFMVHHGLCQKT